MLHRTFEHNRWADERMLEVLQAAEEPPEKALQIFAHGIAAQVVWLDRIQGQEQSSPVWPQANLATIAEAIPVIFRRFDAVLRSDDLNRPVAYTNSAGREFSTCVGDILMHIALHGAYHRGQVSLLLREAGLQPAATDYIAYVRGVPAATHKIE